MFQNLLGLLKRGKDMAQIGMSLIPSYLANLLWIIETTFIGLARKGYGQNAAVYACLRILSESVPEPPMLVHFEADDGTLQRAPVSHAAQVLIRKPNELQTEYAFWELVTLFLGITGRVIAWKERDNAGRVIGLWPLRPDRVGPIYSTLGDEGAKVVKGWSYQVPGTSEYLPIPRSETVMFVIPDPAGESGGLVEGLGPLQVLAREVSADNEATSLVGALLANYAQPSILIKTAIPLPSAEDARIIKESFRMQMGGAHRGEPAILDGNASIEKLSFDLNQLEFPNLRDVSESRISAAFGVPAILVGLKVGIQASIKATIEEQRELFTEGTLASYWRRYQDAIDSDLLPEFGPNLKSSFDTTKVKALAHQSKEDQDKISEGYQNGAATLDEYRERVLGLPPIGGTTGALRFVASTGNFVDADGLPLMPPMPAMGDGQGGDEQDAEDSQRTAKAIAMAMVLAMGATKARRPLPKGLRHQLLRLVAQSEAAEISQGNALQPRLQATLNAQRDALVTAVSSAVKAAEWVDYPDGRTSTADPAETSIAPPAIKAAWTPEGNNTWSYQHDLGTATITLEADGKYHWSIAGAVNKTGATDTLDKAKATAGAHFSKAKAAANIEPAKVLEAPGFLQALGEMSQVLAEGHTASVQLGYQQTHADLGEIRPPSLNLHNPHVSAAIAQSGTQIKGITATTLKLVRAVLQAGIANGSTYDEVAGALHTSAAFSEGRARTIARTEMGMAYGRGASAAMRDLDSTHVYVTDGDDWDAPCIEANGTVQTIEWYEANLKEHPNCTRAAAPVPESDTPKNDHGPLHLGYARFHWLENPFNASTITAAGMGKDLDAWTKMNGVPELDKKAKAQARRDAESLEHAAETQLSKHDVVYRGFAVKDLIEFQHRFAKSQSVMLRGLGEASTDLSEAAKAAKWQKSIGLLDSLDEGDIGTTVPVVVELHNPNGIIGYDLGDDKTLIQNGATYRVSSITQNTADGVYHVEAWATEKAHQPIVKPAKPKKTTAAPGATPAATPEATTVQPPAQAEATSAPATAPNGASTPTTPTTPTPVYAVGDHVQLNNPGDDLHGQIGKILKVNSSGTYTVEFPNGDAAAFTPDLLLPSPAPAPSSSGFSLGDSVQVTAPQHDLAGQIGTVTHVSSGGQIITAQFPDGTSDAFAASDLSAPTTPAQVATSSTSPAAAAPKGPVGKWVQQPITGVPTWEYQHATLGAAIIQQNVDGTYTWSINGALTKSGTTDSLDKAKATSGAYFSKLKAGTISGNPGPKPSAKKPTPQANPQSSAPNPQSSPAPGAPTPTPAVSSPPAPQSPPQAIAASQPPFDVAQLVVNDAEGQGLGGVHAKTVYNAPDGSLWLFKPQEALTTAVDVATWRIVDLAGFDAAKSETYQAHIGGQLGSIQRMHGTKATRRAAFGKFGDFDPTKIDAADGLELQKHAVFDWLISNHDTHHEQFVRVSGDRTIYAVDKGQAFKFFGKDKLDPSYDPNSNAGIGKPSVYNLLHQAYANGDSVQVKSLKNGGNAPLRDFISQLQSVNDSSYREALRPYAELAASRPGTWHNNASGFLDAAVARKANLLSDFEQLYAKLDAERDKALAPKRAAIPAGLIGMDGARDFTTDTEGDRYGDSNWPTMAKAGFTLDELAALKSYKGSGYDQINGRPGTSYGLRNNPSLVTNPSPQIKAIDVALKKHPFKEDTIVRRGTDVNDAMPGGPAKYVGGKWIDQGFLSTSLGTRGAFSGSLKLTIRVPAGTPTYWMDHLRVNDGEREVLLPRGAEYFVHSARLNGSTWEVEMEMVPNSYKG